jgi:hypothetical protein
MIYFSYFLILILTVVVSFSQLFLAQLYAYEILQSSLVTGVYLLIVITFDKEIMKLTEQIGFQKKLSRSYKFYLLFLVISLFILGTVLMSGMSDIWVRKQNWMFNVIDNSNTCQKKLKQSYILMGNSYTFNKSAQLWFLCGMGFGVSYSMTKINVLDWINSNIWIKACRMTMAVGIYFVIYFFF